MKKIILTALLIVYSNISISGDVKLKWDASISEGVKGYEVYYGEGRNNYNFTPIDVGNVTEYTVRDLTNNNKYYFAIKAYNSTIKSDYSNEVSATVSEPIPVNTNGLVAAYSFEEDGIEVIDQSGNRNTGTILGATRYDVGYFGKGIMFDGENDVVEIKDSDSLDISSKITIEAWINPSSPMNSWRSIVAKEQDNQIVYQLFANTNIDKPAFVLWIDGGEKVSNSRTQVFFNKWQHLSATYDGKYQRFYINGILKNKKVQTGKILVSNGSLYIGGNKVWGEHFKGIIDEVRIYNRALSRTQIINDMKTRVLD